MRWLLLGLASTLYVTAPFPLPLEPEVMCIHDDEVVAVHVQPDGAVTLKLPEPLPDPRVCVVGDMEYEHDTVGEPR